MNKLVIRILSVMILFTLAISACYVLPEASGDSEVEIAQTLVAIAFIQTAMAEIPEPEIEVPEPIETEPPPEEVVEEEQEGETEEIIEIPHSTIPGSGGWINKWFYDTDSSNTASGDYVTAGDDYVANLYERPFTENEMIYRPDVDINKTEMSEDSMFYYVTIYLNDNHPDGGLQAAYAIEIDEDRDGRGNLVVIADHPTSTEWDIAGLSVWKDGNNDVGGSRIMRPDTNYAGDSYEQEVFSIDVLDDPDAAWARTSTGTPVSVYIAFKKTLISRDTFVWGVWAAESLLDPALFDHHDHFTQEEAGSPYGSHSTYPLKALNLIDNTRRETYKFEAVDPIPGLCYTPVQPEPTPTITLTEAPPEEPTEEARGDIHGLAFDDINNNGVRDADETLTVYTGDITIRLHIGSCSDPVLAFTRSNPFTFSNLRARTYCVSMVTSFPNPDLTTPSQFTINLLSGGSQYVEFGFRVVY